MNSDEVALLIQLSIPFSLIAMGFLVGRYREKKHEKNIRKRFQEHSDFLITNLKSCVGAKLNGGVDPKLFCAETVIACDYFKLIAMGLKGLIGGEMRALESLQLRAKNESLLRIVEQAKAEGYTAIANVRFENSDIGGNTQNRGKKKAPMAAVIASATAYCHEE